MALSDAVSLFERRNSDSDPEWFRYFKGRACRRIRALLPRCPEGTHRDELCRAESIGRACGERSDFFVTMLLADANLQVGEAEQACHAALGALPFETSTLAPMLSNTFCVSRLDGLRFRSETALDSYIKPPSALALRRPLNTFLRS